MVRHDVKNIALADKGRLRMEWASRYMPVLNSIKARFAKEQALSRGSASRPAST